MKVLEIINPGKESQLRLAEREPLPLRPGYVRIAIKAFGINRADLMQRRGLYPPPAGETDIPGLEAAGVILETAGDVQEFRTGDRVAALLAAGGYADETVVHHGSLLRLPDTMSFEQGAGLAETWLTAWSNLFREAAISPGKTALIHSGASGVGLSAIDLLKEFGNTVFTTVSSEAKAAVCRRHGADQVIIYTQEDFSAKVKEAGGVDVILDAVGANYLMRNIACLKKRGCLLIIGLMSGSKAEISLGDVLMKNLTIKGTTLRSRPIEEKAEITASFREKVMPLFEAGRLSVTLDSVFPVSDIELACARMASNQNIGKIVVTW